tara:strand:- start:4 stop:195 length:192 start_codon:yes stop_codon:yes gene_type:complete
MNIETAKYQRDNTTDSKENIGIIAVIDGRTWTVPLDPANTHYIEIMRQVDAGELTIAPADEEE